MTCVVIFFCVNLLMFVYFNKRINRASPLLLISLFWVISSAFGIYVYCYDLIPNIRERTTIMPYAFLLGCMMLSFSPFYKINFAGIRNINACNYEKLLFYFSCLLIVFSFLPLAEHLILLLKNNGDAAQFQQQLSDIYEMKRENDVSQLSFPSRMMNGFSSNFRCVTIVLFFYFIGKEGYSRTFKILLFLPILNSVLEHFLGASRASLFFDLANIFLIFLIVQGTYSPNLRRKVKKVLFIIAGSIVSLLSIVSVARYFFSSKTSLGTSSIFDWIAIYFGEATVRFNTQMWDISAYMQGDNSFSFVKSLLGFPTFVDLLERRAYWTPKTKISTHVFYTFIGDFYGDFGPIGCVLVVLAFVFPCFLIARYVRRHKDSIKFHHLVYISLWGSICLYGFTYFLYKTYYGFRCFFVQVLFALILAILSNPSFKRKK